MTTLGKILVVVNFVFTLVTGTLIIVVFAVRTNWHAGYNKLAKNYEVSQANVKTYAEEAKETKVKLDAEIKRQGEELAKAKEREEKLKVEIAAKDKQIQDQEIIARRAGVSTETATAELQRRRDELKKERENVSERDKSLLELEMKNKVLLDKFVRADIAARSSNDRAQRLAEQLESMSRENEKMKAGAVSTATGAVVRRPPPEDVEGIILDTDKTGLVTISLGSDAGISKGNTLEVYRLKPEPKYLGTIRILEVNHHEAVGRPLLAQKAGTLQKGDRVASSILGQR